MTIKKACADDNRVGIFVKSHPVVLDSPTTFPASRAGKQESEGLNTLMHSYGTFNPCLTACSFIENIFQRKL